MDCNRLPSDASKVLYIYKHPNAETHVQRVYMNGYTVNPKNIIKSVIPHENIVENKKQVIRKQSNVESFIVPPQPPAPPPSPSPQPIIEDAKIIVTEEVVIDEKVIETVTLQTPLQPVDIWKFMVGIIDETSSLYTDNMWRDAIESMKNKLIVLMTAGSGHKKYGPKKSRTILAWLTDNKRGTPASAETAKVIAEFVSWLLDVSVSSVENGTNQVDANTHINTKHWFMFRKRGTWMLK